MLSLAFRDDARAAAAPRRRAIWSSEAELLPDNNMRAAYIATCVGSLQACTLRLANADRDRPNEIKTYDQRFEIVSVVGTISCEGAHIHLGLADATGAGVGGHLISATVFTTAEIVLGEVPRLAFDRRFDDATGFKELVVQRRRTSITSCDRRSPARSAASRSGLRWGGGRAVSYCVVISWSSGFDKPIIIQSEELQPEVTLAVTAMRPAARASRHYGPPARPTAVQPEPSSAPSDCVGAVGSLAPSI